MNIHLKAFLLLLILISIYLTCKGTMRFLRWIASVDFERECGPQIAREWRRRTGQEEM